MFLQDFHKSYIFAVAQGGRVETEVDIDGSTVGHVRGVQQQPGNCAANNRKLAIETAENLADLD